VPESKKKKPTNPTEPETPAETPTRSPELLAIKPKKAPEPEPTSTDSQENPEPAAPTPEATNPKLEHTEKTPPPTTEVTSSDDRPQRANLSTNLTSTNFTSRSAPSRPSLPRPVPRRPQPPPYRNLEEYTNSHGEKFLIGDRIQAQTSNYGVYTVEIRYLYEANDGSVWASYSHTDKEQRHPWRWGCCPANLLKKDEESAEISPDTTPETTPEITSEADEK
jgi:hypothetical protein